MDCGEQFACAFRKGIYSIRRRQREHRGGCRFERLYDCCDPLRSAQWVRRRDDVTDDGYAIQGSSCGRYRSVQAVESIRRLDTS